MSHFRRIAALAALTLVFPAFALIKAPLALAGPDTCFDPLNPLLRLTCQGDQSAGLLFDPHPSLSLVNSVVFQNLNQNIGGNGITLTPYFLGEQEEGRQMHIILNGTAPMGVSNFGIARSGNDAAAISVSINAGVGDDGANATHGVLCIDYDSSQAGGTGMIGRTLRIDTSNTFLNTSGANAEGIRAQTGGGPGGGGGHASECGRPSWGGVGAVGGSMEVYATNTSITTSGAESAGIVARSVGGTGGPGGNGHPWWDAASGNRGGQGGAVTIIGGGTINTNGNKSAGIFALSKAGNGGWGGDGGFFGGGGGPGSTGGIGGFTSVDSSFVIVTDGEESHGIAAYSTGGIGGEGGDGSFFNPIPGGGGTAGHAGNVLVTNRATITTHQKLSNAIDAQSIGGHGGLGGGSPSIVYFGANGGSAGNAGRVDVDNFADLLTHGAESYGISAQAVGGGGGNGSGGFSIFFSNGGDGGYGGNGGIVDVSNEGSITVSGVDSRGIFAQSIGGGGGNGGNASGLANIGGRGGGKSDADTVTVNNSGTILSTSHAIFAESVGGGGGNGGDASGWFSVGGHAGGGGDGKTVTVTNTGSLLTTQRESSAIFAQSVGGGGGNGGNSIAGGIVGSLAIGGDGGEGGNGGEVWVTSDTGAISAGLTPGPGGTGVVTGYRSHGIFAQSVGGGGGNGGYAIAATVGNDLSFAAAIGGVAEGGGDSMQVNVQSSSEISTYGKESHAIFAQSVGGGGGTGGFAIAGAAGNTFSGSLAIGGNGGDGGNGERATVNNSGSLFTLGDRSYGILAQSVGGGGGDGGFAVAGAVVGSGVSVTFGLGGNGATGGISYPVAVDNSGDITTRGADAHGLFAQSVGGGGGSGGLAVAGGIGGGLALNMAFGGRGSAGGNGSTVTVGTTQATSGTIRTEGHGSKGIVAQSVGGGGGSGGAAIAGGITKTGSANFSLGGEGGGGRDADAVVANIGSTIFTQGNDAHGLFAQSVGGGGGNGGFAISGGVSISGGQLGIAIGGKGAGGGNAQTVNVTKTGGAINTAGDRSYGLLAQSVGGGGGDGGFAVAGGITKSGSANFAMGGNGASGGISRAVTVDSSSDITTLGDESHAFFAQSLGGGGGSGGFAVTGDISLEGGSAGISVGGFGAGGGTSSTVDVGSLLNPVTGELRTSGWRSFGLVAQSVGGGGGDGGFSVSGSITKGPSARLAVGGGGGEGNNAGAVNVFSNNLIVTGGDDAHGLFAQSLGGGGGSGGFAVAGAISKEGGSAGAAIGGFGEGGGNASGVTVRKDSGSITTTGARSHALYAESVGGGGGNGGFAVAGGITKSSSVNFSLGGFGDTGGDGGEVSVRSAVDLTTSGASSHGLFAQSVGGGGGNGGFAVAGSLFSNDSANPTVNLAFGGYGDRGGHAQAVRVGAEDEFISGAISTSGERSYGIFAQSVGKGGGDGGFAVAGGFSKSPTVTASVGGGGGEGGNGGLVDLFSNSTVTTTGAHSHGLWAQSLGGGGGAGGFAFGLSMTTDITSVTATVGGFGGEGGTSSDVHLNNTGGVTTSGDDAYGVFAQSLGGGGGEGGFAISGSFSSNPNGAKVAAFAVGGFGGDGATSGNVRLDNAGTVLTHGLTAHGVVAQTLGGSGGKGGFAISAAIGQVSNDRRQTNVNLSVAVGGGGGDGNSAGTADLYNTGQVTTNGDGARGLYAYSIGGGGGDGGMSISFDAAYGAANKGNSINVGVSVGGMGGEGNIGGDVLLDNTGLITTFGDRADGILAQSVGGGGGDGGSARSLTLVRNQGGQTNHGKPEPGKTWAFNASVGGNGGLGNHAGTVTVENDGNVFTHGPVSRGVVALSVGGGGGQGGDGIKGLGIPILDDVPGITNNIKSYRNWNIAVGGNGGSSGDGRRVEIDNTGTVTTLGLASSALMAQSIGGGGGHVVNFASGLTHGGQGGSASTGAMGKFGIGGAGGSSGDGGEVEVVNSGDLWTQGHDSFGIFAQSVGGGGGLAGSVDRGLSDELGPIPALNIGLGLGFGQDGGAAGNGKLVRVYNEADITTFGIGSHGIFAQSVGGGGGKAGGLGISPINNPLLEEHVHDFAGSTGGDGDAGNVTVDHIGIVSVSGVGTHGILAQSSAGNGTSGIVQVNVSGGGVQAFGLNADGIVAQSQSNNGNSGVFVTVASGSTVVGGTGEGVAVRVRDGLANQILNHGTIAARNIAQSFAIVGEDRDETVVNHGTVAGSVNLGTGSNAFNNLAGATFHAGPVANLGGGTLTNHGTLIAGAVNPGDLLEINGNLAQEDTGVLSFDFDRLAAVLDRVNVGGTAHLAGTIDVNYDTGDGALITPGIVRHTLVTATGGLTRSDDLALDIFNNSLVTRYSLLTPNANELALEIETDFTPQLVALSQSQAAFGEYLNSMATSGLASGLQAIGGIIATQTDPAVLKAVYDQLVPQGFLAAPLATLTSSGRFGNSMLSCREREGPNRFVREGRCGWFNFSSSSQRQSFTADDMSMRQDVATLAGGFQFALNDRWHAGLALSRDAGTMDVRRSIGPSYVQTTEGELFQAGAVLKGNFGATTLSGGLTFGRGTYESDRSLSLMTSLLAKSEQPITSIATQVRLAHAFEGNRWYLRPMIDGTFTSIRRSSFTETGAGIFEMRVSGSTDSFVSLQPSLELGTEMAIANGTLFRLYGRFGLTRLLSGEDPEVLVGFDEAGAGVAPFSLAGSLDRDLREVAAGLDVLTRSGIVVRLSYTGQFSDRMHQNTAGLRFAIPFR